ncbi:MAG: mechanosensitive ion channel family protein [Endomicrobiales bacterium]|nr:mechanosensitive ion channel family protein [Endomicrobiales bacterium]
MELFDAVVESFVMDWQRWGLGILAVLVFWVLGFYARKIVFHYLHKISKKTETRIDDILIRRSKRPILAIFIVMGLIAGSRIMPVNGALHGAVNKTAVAAMLIIVTYFVAVLLVDIVGEYGARVFSNVAVTSLAQKMIYLTVIALGALVVLSQLGISITPILTALGVGSLAVALALQDTLTNLFAGFHILASRQVRPGDYISLDSGQEGYVLNIGWRTTSIRQLPNNIVIIPNSKLSSSIVTNYWLPEKEMSVLVQVGVSYASNLKKVEEVTIDVAREVLKKTTGGTGTFEPFIRYHTFGDSSINFTVILRVNEFVDQYLVKHEFVKELQERYGKEGIEIPFPQRVVHMNPQKSK